MTSAALVDLSARIATNTLTASQQAALTEALARIAPTFPDPDALSNSIPPDEEALAREWMAALYAVQAEGASGAVTTTGILIFPDEAALAAFDSSTSVFGQEAFVQTYGAYWTLDTESELPARRGVVVVDAAGHRWLRGVTGIAAAAMDQAVWTVNPVAGDDENTGAEGSPLRHFAEIVRRWGTVAPTHTHRTIITFLASQPDDTDPVIWRPVLSLDNSETSDQVVALEGVLGPDQVVSHGAITLVAARAFPSTKLTVTLPPSSDYIPGMLVVNETHPSRARLVANVSGDTWTVSQPLTNYEVAFGFGGTPTEVNTWATDDVVTVYELVDVQIADLAPTLANVLPNIDDVMFVSQLNCAAAGFLNFVGSAIGVNWLDASSDRVIQFSSNESPEGSFFFNCDLPAGVAGGETRVNGFLTGPFLGGGIVGGGELVSEIRLEGCTLDLDVIVQQSNPSFPVTVGGGDLGAVCIDAATTIIATAATVFAPGRFSHQQRLWGEGIVDATVRFTYSGDPTLVFLNTGGLKLAGKTTAISIDAGNALNQGIALNPANLKAAAGAAGFGGFAFDLAGAAYVAA